MDGKRVLGLLLCAIALALVLWGLLEARILQVDFAAPPASNQGLVSALLHTQNVYLADDGSLSVGNKPSSLDTLSHDLEVAFSKAKAPADKASQPVVIWATPKTPGDRIDAVRKIVAAGGWTKVSRSMGTVR